MKRDEAHLKFIRDLPCLKNEGMYCIIRRQAAHVRKLGNGGIGIKPDDSKTVPLCHVCHDKQHKGEVSFYGGLEGVKKAQELAQKLYEINGDVEQGILLILRYRKEIWP